MADVTNNVERIMTERLQPNLATAYADDPVLTNFFKTVTDLPRVSEKAVRLVLEVSPGGQTGSVDLDGGDNLDGGRSYKVQPTLTCVTIAHARNVTRLAHLATQTKEQALFDDLTREMDHAMREMKIAESQLLNIGTDGILAKISDIGSAPVYSVNHADNPFGTSLLREGNKYDIFAEAAFPATERADGPYRVDPDGGLDRTAETVTFDQGGAADDGEITADAVDDCIVMHDMANASLQGLPYHLGPTTGTWQGQSRLKRYARCEVVDADNETLQRYHIFRMKTKLRDRRNSEEIDKLTPYYSPAQEHNYFDLTEGFMLMQKTSDGKQDFDLMYGNGTMFNRKPIIDAWANPNKMFWLDKTAFVKATVAPLAFYKDPGTGKTTFHGVSTTNGKPDNNIWFQVEHRWQLGVRHLESMGVIENLQTPDDTYVGFLA